MAGSQNSGFILIHPPYKTHERWHIQSPSHFGHSLWDITPPSLLVMIIPRVLTIKHILEILHLPQSLSCLKNHRNTKIILTPPVHFTFTWPFFSFFVTIPSFLNETKSIFLLVYPYTSLSSIIENPTNICNSSGLLYEKLRLYNPRKNLAGNVTTDITKSFILSLFCAINLYGSFFNTLSKFGREKRLDWLENFRAWFWKFSFSKKERVRGKKER